MSEPVNPAPQASSVTAVDPKPWWQRKSTVAGILAFCAGAPVLVNQLTPILTPKQASTLSTIAACLAALAGIFGRSGGVQAAARSLEQSQGGPSA